MKMSMDEKRALYAFGCPEHANTVNRLKQVEKLTFDPSVQRMLKKLTEKLISLGNGEWYRQFYYNLRTDLETYSRAKHQMRAVEDESIVSEIYDYDPDEE